MSQDCSFRVRNVDAYSEYRKIAVGVPQGSVLGTILYLLYTADSPKTPEVSLANYTDDTAILDNGKTIGITTEKL